MNSPSLCFLNSVAWNLFQFTFALYLGLDFSIQICFYLDLKLCFFLFPALNSFFTLPSPPSTPKLYVVTDFFFSPGNIPCGAPCIFWKSHNSQCPKMSKGYECGPFSLIVLDSPWACSILKLISCSSLGICSSFFLWWFLLSHFFCFHFLLAFY